jgi:hypothetical protein
VRGKVGYLAQIANPRVRHRPPLKLGQDVGLFPRAYQARYPMLRGTIRDHVTQQRRAFVRFFACGEDLSHESPDRLLPEAVLNGVKPLLIVGAIAGG